MPFKTPEKVRIPMIMMIKLLFSKIHIVMVRLAIIAVILPSAALNNQQTKQKHNQMCEGIISL